MRQGIKPCLQAVLVSALSVVVLLTAIASIPLLHAIVFSTLIGVFSFAILFISQHQKSSGNTRNSTRVLDEILLNLSPDAIVIASSDLIIEKLNEGAEKLFLYKNKDLLTKSLVDTLFSKSARKHLENLLNAPGLDGVTEQPELSVVKKNGTPLLVSVRASTLIQGEDKKLILYFRDKAPLIDAEIKLRNAINNDELTGLPNRHVAMQHIKDGISHAIRSDRLLMVLKVGIDRFKHINESRGHDVGDKLIMQVAERLKLGVRRGDMVSRINGDQFVVTLIDIDKNTNLDSLVRKFVDSFSHPFNLENDLQHVSISIGIACYPNDAESVESLLQNAESAMFQAKEKGGSHFRYYSHEMREKAKERLQLENELRRAISRNELDVFYQPQVDLKSGKIIGVEALVRWFHPDLGSVSPIKFIPLAEEVGLISEIGQWVMKRACADMTLMARQRDEVLGLSINLSAHQFMDDCLVSTVADTLNETGFPANKLEFEITESLFMEDVEVVTNTLNILSQQGINISMDDFGTGYSSLSYLKRFPINTIKVDRSFVKDIVSDQDNASIVSATIQMAHSLSLDIVAEGVETEDQLRFLINEKCDKMQGFYFSQPLSFKALVNLLEENRQIELNSDKICLISGYR